jgi:hypothetical protein
MLKLTNDGEDVIETTLANTVAYIKISYFMLLNWAVSGGKRK